MDAWRESVAVYREFRQTPRGAKHKKVLKNGKTANVDGRSHWPEADSIRHLTGCALKPAASKAPSTVPADEDTHDHSTPIIPAAAIPSFARAALGLPINFHFADGPNKDPARIDLDPKDVQVYPLLATNDGENQRAERMASPIITRPLFRDGGWFPAVLVFPSPLVRASGLRVEGAKATLTGDLLTDLPLSAAIDSALGSLKPMRGKPNAIDALIDFLTTTKNFAEVAR